MTAHLDGCPVIDFATKTKDTRGAPSSQEKQKLEQARVKEAPHAHCRSQSGKLSALNSLEACVPSSSKLIVTTNRSEWQQDRIVYHVAYAPKARKHR